MAKALYSKLFDWLTARINAGIKEVQTGSKINSIGVLDIFGFEIFVVNSFEQLCINLANEKLQFHFNGHIFTLELEAYNKEGLDVEQISFKDNQGCLDLIEMKKTGILSMIEEEIYVPRGSDDTLLEKLHKQQAKSEFYSKPKMKGGKKGNQGPVNCFVVSHFAGEVSYSVTGFLEKCKDRLPADSEALVKNANNALVKSLFSVEESTSTGRTGGRPPTLGGQFKNSLADLYETLMATEPHFIKCVKPNGVKKTLFDAQFTLYQLSYLGLLEVIRIRKSGYPVRFEEKEFVGRYRLLLDCADNHWPSSKELALHAGIEGEWQIGKTMVFMRDQMYNHLESERAKVMASRVRVMQAWILDELVRKQWANNKAGYTAVQAAFRGARGREAATRRRQEVDVENLCEEALKMRKEPLCVAAIEAAEALQYTPTILEKVRFVIDRIRDEKEVEEMLRHATFTKQIEDVEEALKSVTLIGLEEAWSGLPSSDERAGLIPRAKMLQEQLTKYAGLMQTLAEAMKVRTISALQAAITEAERLQLECPEVDEARAMVKMAEFETESKAARQERKKHVATTAAAEPTARSKESEKTRINVQVAAVTPLLRAAMSTHSKEKLSVAIEQAKGRLGDDLLQHSTDFALATNIMQAMDDAATTDPDAIKLRLDDALKTAGSDADMEAKQTALSSAIAIASKSGLQVPIDITKAWQQISEASVVSSMLAQAKMSKSRRLLEIATKRASNSKVFGLHAGAAGQKLLGEATELHNQSQEQYEARQVIDDAIKAADVGKLQAALEAAKSSGLADTTEINYGERILEQLKTHGSIPELTKTRNVAPVYRMSRLPTLSNRMFPLYCSRIPLLAPLLSTPAGCAEASFTNQALAVSKMLCSIMWPGEAEFAEAAGAGETTDTIQTFLKVGTEDCTLRDEIMVQMIRQVLGAGDAPSFCCGPKPSIFEILNAPGQFVVQQNESEPAKLN